MKRREQFNISALKFNDEVYRFIEEKSKHRQLSDWISEAALKEIRCQGASTGEPTSQEVLNELKDIKHMLRQLECTARAKPLEASPTSIIQQVSNDVVHHLLDESDVSYDY